MIDVKKLITGFLILATAAGASGIILSFVTSATVTSTAVTQPTIDQNATTTLADNAFLPSESITLPTYTAAQVASSTLFVTSTDPNNLTDVLATSFVNGVVAANPSGPTGVDASGNPTFISPDANALAANVADTTTTENLQIPDWDVEAEAIPITIVKTATSSQVFQYGTTVNDILTSHMNTQAQTILNDGVDGASASDLTYLQSQIQSALGDTAALKTPSSAASFQKSLLALLVYEKNMLALINTSQTDPVKASLIFQAEDGKFSTVEQNFQTQADAIASQTVSLERPAPKESQNAVLSFVNNIFGIQQAHAQWTVFDPSTWGLIEGNEAHLIATQVETVVKNTLLQILKNSLIAIIQQKVLTWVQGSGAPRFITQWGATLVNAAQTSAINYINGKMTCGTYTAFIPQIRADLKTFTLPSTNSCANQFAAALGNNTLQQFYNNFQNGGFVAFGASTLPSGNPYGTEFFQQNILNATAQTAQSVATAQATATGGFKGGDVCDDGSDPINGQHLVCEGPDQDFNSGDQKTCPTGYTPDWYDNNGVCADGNEPQVTTPAAVTAFALNSSIDATPKQVAAANDIAGVLNSVLSSLLTNLANTAVNAAGQVVSKGLTSITSNSISNGNATPPPPLPLSCDPSSQTIPFINASTNPPTFIAANGGTTDSNGNLPTYYWASSNGTTSTGAFFSETFPNPGTYVITLGDSVPSDATTTCSVTVQ